MASSFQGKGSGRAMQPKTPQRKRLLNARAILRGNTFEHTEEVEKMVRRINKALRSQA